MSKKKWIYFGILTSLLICFIFVAIKYCDIPIWESAPDFFVKPKNADMLLYNLSISYIASYMFYALVNFIPDWIEAIEKEKEMLALRGAIHREIQLFTSRLISLWNDIVMSASRKESFNILNEDDIKELFNIEFMKKISTLVILSDNSNVKSVSNYYSDWYTQILEEINEISNLGNLILTRYKNDIPSKIFYDLFYIINDSSIMAALPRIIEISTSFNGENIPLSQCIDFESKIGKKNVDRSCQSIISLYDWVNTEYDYIIKNAKVKDNCIKIHNIRFEMNLLK